MAKRWIFLALLAAGLSLPRPATAEETDCDCEGPPARWQVGTEYLVFWLNQATFPILATTGRVSDPIPGALGQPGTRILARGPLDHNEGSAGRVSLVYWIDPDRTIDLEGNFFGAEQQSQFFSAVSNANGSPLLTRPFFDPQPAVNAENSVPRSLPGLLAGSINFTYMTRLMGAEANARYDIQGWGWQNGISCSMTGGMRFLKLDEKYVSFDNTVQLPAGTASSFNFSDNFTTYNTFVGAQLGSRVRFRWDHDLFVDLEGKLAIGPNYQSVRISGLTNQYDAAGNLVATGNQGLYAQPTNVGTYDSSEIAILPELAVNFNWDIAEFLRFKVGYTYFSMNRVVRPGDQISHVVNIQAIGQTNPIPPLEPQFIRRESVIWFQAINVGLEFTF